jgi:hypothetical protein
VETVVENARFPKQRSGKAMTIEIIRNVAGPKLTARGLETRISRLEQRNAVLEQSLKVAELGGAAAELSTGLLIG